MDFEVLWTIGFILLAAGIVALFARLIYRTVKGKSCSCGSSCSGSSCSHCQMCSREKEDTAKSDDEKKD